MDDLLFIIVLLSIILVALSNMRLGKLINPLSIIVVWWSGWLFVSNLSLTGLFIPSTYTQSLVMLMLVGLISGAMFPYAPPNQAAAAEYVNRGLYSKCSKLYYLNICFFPIVTYYLSRALNILFSANLIDYRNLVFEGIEGVEKSSLLFKYSSVEYLFNFIVSPMIFLSLLLSIVFYIYYNDKKYLLSSLLLVSMEAVMRMGRFAFYYIIVLFLLSVFFLYQKYRSKELITTVYYYNIKSKVVKIMSVMVVLFLVVLFLSILRTKEDVNIEGVSDVFKEFFIDYHTVGFTLLDIEISNEQSLVNTRLSYGRSILGGIDDPVIILLRRFDNDLISIVREAGTERYVFTQVGYYENGLPKFSNAFYTIISSLYMDGREPFVFLASAFFGLVLSRYYLRWLASGYLSDLSLVLYLSYMAIFSIFMSIPEGSLFWIVLAILVTLNKKQYKNAEIFLLNV